MTPSPSPTPTDEQLAIIEATRTSKDNLLVNALAGTGKTSTIEMLCRAITDIPILYIAFNKRVVTEAKERMPGHVECLTQNSLGHRVWAQATGRKLVLANDKMRTILRAVISDQPRRAQETLWDDYSDIMTWLQRAKRDGFVPTIWDGPVKRLYSSLREWASKYGEVPEHIEIINTCLCRSISAAYEGGIDFDDQIYMPVLFSGTWPRFPLTVIDEAQDLSPLNHEMLASLVGNRRLIAVGDPWQSIYAFRGAICNGMDALASRFAMKRLTLSMTFRVPKVGVERARTRVPFFIAHEANPAGEVIELTSWGPSDIPTEAAILCRNNAPLLSLAFKLLRANRAIKLVGMDIGANLVRALKKLGPPTLTGQALSQALAKWRTAQLAAGRAPAGVEDRFECLTALCFGRTSLGDAILAATDLFKREGPIQLLSIHRSKGLEWNEVFHLDPWRIPSKYADPDSEEWEQELNVRYVGETRFKRTMYLVNLEDFDA